MTKKLFTVVMAVVLTACYAQAQITFGARAGLNLTKMSGDDTGDSKMKPGFQLGVVADYAVSDAFSIQPGLLFVTQGDRTNESATLLGISMEEKTKFNLNYLQIPINARYKIDLSGMTLLLQAGPYIGFALGGKYKTEVTAAGVTETDDGNIEIGSGDDDEIKRGDFGLGLGAGLQFGNIQAGLGYNIGLANISTYDNETLKNNGLVLTVTYLFGK